jgi:hypothetical protein
MFFTEGSDKKHIIRSCQCDKQREKYRKAMKEMEVGGGCGLSISGRTGCSTVQAVSQWPHRGGPANVGFVVDKVTLG